MRGQAIQVCLLALLWGGKSDAHPQDKGRVSMRGSIIETPCTIDMLSRDQSIDMGTTPVGVIARGGHGETRPFSIQLIKCTLARHQFVQPDWRYFQATFDGERSGKHFAVGGSTWGVALELTDASGNIAHPGQPLPPGMLTGKNTRLDYNLRLVSDRAILRTDEFTSTLRLKMDYY